jgi:hypothetical protein
MVRMIAVSGARGAPLGDLVPASIIAVIDILFLVAVAVAHRRGGLRVLARLSNAVEERTGLPGWAGIPTALAAGSLGVAAFGYYWDVSWHIDRGRDPGPFANPAHWFIIVGLAGIALAGLLSVILGDERTTGASVRILPGWNAPIGGVLLAVCGVIALAGFPLDDVWHRIFGQDVTAWGPTHIQMIGGASLATLAAWALSVEGWRVAAANGRTRPAWVAWLEDVGLAGAFLIGLSTLQVEFDYGVPQFRQIFHPMLIMLAAGIGLVAARIRAGRGGALGAVAVFLALRGALTVGIVALGRSTLHFPLYVVEALVVEAVALVVDARRDALRFAALCGVGIGTLGLASEWLWSHAFMPLPWGRPLWPQAAVFGLLTALAGSVIGGLIGRSLSADEIGARMRPAPLAAVAAAWLVALVCIGWPLPTTASAARATFQLTDVPGRTGRWVDATVRIQPPTAADGANWFRVLSWQGEKDGNGGLVIASLHEIAPGVYRTTQPVPVYGTWKTLLRLHRGSVLEVAPLYMPADAAIPAPAVHAASGVTRAFVRDKKILQREAVGGSVGLQRAAYALLAVIAIAWVGSLAWGLRRLAGARLGRGPRAPGAVARTPASQPA